MGRRVFIIFLLTITAITTAAVVYIQSEKFAEILKKEIRTRVTKNLGLDVDFERMKIGVFPPSVSLVNVKTVVLKKDNPIGLGEDSVIFFESLGFNFRMFQAFSRGIAVNKVFINTGKVALTLPSSQSKDSEKFDYANYFEKQIILKISDQFSIHIRQLEIRDLDLNLKFSKKEKNDFLEINSIKYLAITPSKEGTNLVANFENVFFSFGDFSEKLAVLKINADLNKKQIDLVNLDVQRRAAAIHARGTLLGDLNDFDKVRIDLDAILRTPLEELKDLTKDASGLSGELRADLKAVGTFGNPSFQGTVGVESFQYRLWNVDKISLVGSYHNNGIILDSAELLNGQSKIAIKNQVELALPIKNLDSSLNLALSKFKFSDFSGDLKKDVSNLEFEADGIVNISLALREAQKKISLNSLIIRPNLSVQKLELNNQKFGIKRPYQKIFSTTPFKLNAEVDLKDGGVNINNLLAVFESGQLSGKGRVDKKNGFNIDATTELIDLGKEIKDIGGNLVSGVGSLNLKVRGPSESVRLDFEINAKDTVFGNFNIGKAKGVISYRDGDNEIRLIDIEGGHDRSSYLLSGKVDLSEKEKIELTANFSDSDPNDIFKIFAVQLKKISWIPHGMTGSINGNVLVGGTYSKDLETLEISGNLTGNNLGYVGEIVHDFSSRIELKNNRIHASAISARKYETQITGEISYNLFTDEMLYWVEADRGKVRNIDYFASTGIPLDGIFFLRSDGKGTWEKLNSKTTIEVKSVFARTKPIDNFDFLVETKDGITNMSGHFGEDLDFDFKKSSQTASSSFLRVNSKNKDIGFILCLLNKEICLDPNLELRLGMGGELNWHGSNWTKSNGKFLIQDLKLLKSGVSLQAEKPIQISFDEGFGKTNAPIHFSGEETNLKVSLSGDLSGKKVENSVIGNSTLRILEFISPVIEESKGTLDLNLAIKGSLSQANFMGSLSIPDGVLRIKGVDALVENLKGKINLSGNRVSIESLSGQLGGGVVQLTGGLDLYLDKAPRFFIDAYMNNNRLKFVPVNFIEIGEAKISFTGNAAPYTLGGTAKIKRVMMRNNFDVATKSGAKTARYLPEKINGEKSFYIIKIKAIAENGVVVDNNLLDAEFRGELTLLNTFASPQIIARAELVKGKLLFRNTAFTLDHAYIRAPNPEVLNPQFSVGGVANVDTYKINIFASGTIDKPKISLTSSPSLAQEDIISLLAFGYRGEDTKRLRSSDTSAITYSEVGSILLEQLQLSQNLQQKGIKVSVQPSINDGNANLLRRNDQTSAAAPKVYIQTQIVKNLEAAFGGTLGSTQGQEVDARLEYHLGSRTSVSAVYEQEPELDVKQQTSSFGGDLKFRWGFK
ncbi:MAG: translocation/assembly module TamB [Oligoflexia bacterium]|nr:translocation/assembly module TamB [Oligoflexia bacterium]